MYMDFHVVHILERGLLSTISIDLVKVAVGLKFVKSNVLVYPPNMGFACINSGSSRQPVNRRSLVGYFCPVRSYLPYFLPIGF